MYPAPPPPPPKLSTCFERPSPSLGRSYSTSSAGAPRSRLSAGSSLSPTASKYSVPSSRVDTTSTSARISTASGRLPSALSSSFRLNRLTRYDTQWTSWEQQRVLFIQSVSRTVEQPKEVKKTRYISVLDKMKLWKLHYGEVEVQTGQPELRPSIQRRQSGPE